MNLIKAIRTDYGVQYETIIKKDIDKSIYIKTKKEKRKLKRLKKECELSHINSSKPIKNKQQDHKGKLVIYIKPKWRRPKLHRDNFKSVIVIRCYRNEINSYLDFAKRYNGFKSNTEDKIIKYDYKI